MADVETPQLEVVEIPEVEEAAGRAEPLPEALPILPLRETVTFPDTLTPLAVGQERSIKLVDDDQDFFNQFVKTEMERWGTAIRASGVQIE